MKTGVTISEFIFLADTILLKQHVSHLVTDNIYAYDFLAVVRKFLKSLSETVTLSDTATRRLGLLLVDYLHLADTLSSVGHLHHTLTDAVALADLINRGFAKGIAETISVTDIAHGVFVAALLLQDTMTSADTVTRQYTGNCLILSSVTTTDTVTAQASLQQVISELINFNIRLVIGGEVYQCWVLNTDRLYPSLYTNYGFNSFATLKGQTYAAKSDGIYLIGGADDDGTPIETGVRLAMARSAMLTQYHDAYFGVIGDAPAVRFTNENGAITYNIIQGRAKAALGPKGKEWTFDLVGVTDVQFIELHPINLTRSR